jgi:putative ABC transport system permease protein
MITRQMSEAFGIRPGDVVQLTTDPRAARQEPSESWASTSRGRSDADHGRALRGAAAPAGPAGDAVDPTDPGGAEAVSAINVALLRPAEARDFARELVGRVPGLAARPTAAEADDDNPFVVLQRFHLAISVVTLVASTIFLLALMVMLVEERRETIGMLRLIGLRRRRILLQVFSEGLLIAFLGALFGVLLAGACQGLFNRILQWRYDTALVFVRVTRRSPGAACCWLLPFGMAASLVSSWGLLRRPIVSLARR